jgi:hypothetical protein
MGDKSQAGQGAENRRRAFTKLAEDRMVKAINAITLIGNLSNKKNYKFTERDVEAMEAALQKTVKQTMLHFRSPRAERPTFRLPDDDE